MSTSFWAKKKKKKEEQEKEGEKQQENAGHVTIVDFATFPPSLLLSCGAKVRP